LSTKDQKGAQTAGLRNLHKSSHSGHQKLPQSASQHNIAEKKGLAFQAVTIGPNQHDPSGLNSQQSVSKAEMH